MKNNKVSINVFPRSNSWKQRLTVIFSTLFGIPYHYTASKENLYRSIEESDKAFYRNE